MHIGEAIIAFMAGLALAGYSYRDTLLRLDLWILGKLPKWIRAYTYRGRHHIDVKQLQTANFTNTLGDVCRRTFRADRKGRVVEFV